ncbi:Satratoxin biosynthesis SC3 cluster transcription factor SAT20 [Pseudocercospora fuligena]|uniref:Satratoxin biosynthesis SC3 cluster transcription factor SAT20 n=1 Tax=Pseudocercospora fuligena TaxID=685502 RepID=A0A8H6R5F4_9PEZI|nr:Satratoxin biosynthesis SC3 cluster transcription factor SAT20 [Pseudocercospora fuligena]
MAAPFVAAYGATPFPPPGYDSGLPEFSEHLEDLLSDPSLPPLAQFAVDDMAVLRFDDSDMGWISPRLLDHSAVQSEVAKSPSLGSHPAETEGSISLSPSAASQSILTPSSTFSPYVTNLDDPESDSYNSTSPESDSSTSQYVVVDQLNGETRRSNHRMNVRSARASPSIPSATQATGPSSITSRESSAPQQQMGNPQLQSFASSSSGGMHDYSGNANAQYSSFNDGDFDLFGNTGGSFEENSFGASNLANNTSLPFRTTQGGTIPSQSPFQTGYQQAGELNSSTFAPSSTYPVQGLSNQFNAGNTSFATPVQHFTNDAAFQQFLNASRLGNTPTQSAAFSHAHPTTQASFRSVPSTSSSMTPTQAVPIPRPAYRQPRLQVNITSADGDYSPHSSQSGTSFDDHSTSLGGVFTAIRQADPSMRLNIGTQRATQHEHKVQKGGRKKGIHLTEPSRARSHQMRKIGACWRCAMQRDPCDHGDPCSRCAMRSQRGQNYYFGCERSKLPDFVIDFLPPSLCFDHTKAVLEDTVRTEVVGWHRENSIDVYLSCGYGPPLRWKLTEFTPKSQKLLWQLQYFQDPRTGRSMHRRKYAPPYGLVKLDGVDDANFDDYLKDLLEPFHLNELGPSFYAEENEVDQDMFQCRVLDMMSRLYIGTGDDKLKLLLRDILRMMVITWIMGHTLTITEDTLRPVINNVRHSRTPNDYELQDFHSPRLANRQLKFFFGVLRNQIYEKLLKWLQQTLHTAGKKEQTWLQSFCVILGFAMVLEEIQRTLHCHADASIVRNEATPEQAEVQAVNSCKTIDDRFKLLIGLFQCKYRDKKWGEYGSFGNGTPELKEPIARDFCSTLRNLVEYKQGHLRSRENVPFSHDNQCLYTTRLTARFLLPFLDLPRT